VDYAALGPQLTSANRVSRRTAPKTVPELRDFFNEKSGFPRQSGATQQQPTAHLRQADQSLFPSGLPLNSTYNPMPYMLREEELQGMYEAATADASYNTYAPGLSRSASDNAGRTPSLQNALHRIQQERSFHMTKGEQPVLYSWPEHQPIVQPKAISPKMNTFCKSMRCVIHPTYANASSRHIPPYPRCDAHEGLI
jgi:regulatory protein SWI5